ncbi:SOS response-associated peptidase [Pseudactinotalea terrae]|uniref:SOS response-associated peptidase n=1 Tax=Pseudactinotalea terrae TaxID=1743262 RepID=UPI0012E18AA1|nr:SOS response-associated peptidase [Pseudactinotalea terrae]
MCGRYASFKESQDLADAFDVEDMTEAAREVMASWNVAPTDGARIVVDRAPQLDGDAAEAEPAKVRREMHLARWGLVPPWAKDISIGARMINARSETLTEKPAFKKPAATKRCLVLADGYYEWQKITPPGESKPIKVPHYIHPTDGSPIAFAGLYSWWRDPSKDDDDPDRWLLSTTIVTAEARDGLEAIHDREPAMLTREVAESWLDPSITDLDAVLAMLAEPPPELSWYEVGRAVGNVRNNGPELLQPA